MHKINGTARIDTPVIRLCIEDQRELAAALLDDATPSDGKEHSRLRRAVREHDQKVKSL